jgi:hypothetical protein
MREMAPRIIAVEAGAVEKRYWCGHDGAFRSRRSRKER